MSSWIRKNPWLAACIGAGALAVLLFFASLLVPVVRNLCGYAPQGQKPDCAEHHLGPFALFAVIEVVDHYNGFVTAFATIVMAAFTGTLWFATVRQADFARNALVASRRPFLTPMEIAPQWEFDKATKEYKWRFRPKWFNSGETPTKGLTLYVDAELVNAPLPRGHRFIETMQPGRAVLGPKNANLGGAGPVVPKAAISPQDILDIQANKKYLYLWGWAKYSDIFPGERAYITKFVWCVVTGGDPKTFKPGQDPSAHNSLKFNYFQHPEGNCTDGECDAV